MLLHVQSKSWKSQWHKAYRSNKILSFFFAYFQFISKYNNRYNNFLKLTYLNSISLAICNTYSISVCNKTENIIQFILEADFFILFYVVFNKSRFQRESVKESGSNYIQILPWKKARLWSLGEVNPHFNALISCVCVF